jgi:ribosomal-protein-alanine N-acetyltransferase
MNDVPSAPEVAGEFISSTAAHNAPSVEFAALEVDRLNEVLEIERASSSEPWSEGIFRDELGDHINRSYEVAVIYGRVVGFCGLLMQLDDGHITNIAVRPEHRRQRIGARLLLRACREAILRGAKAMTLEVRVSNMPARQMYQRFGFAPAGIRKGYYRDTGEDALVMWANDVDTAAFSSRLALISQELT